MNQFSHTIRLGVMLYLFAMFVFSWQDVVSKILISDYSVVQIAFIRNVAFFIFLIPLFIKNRKKHNLVKSKKLSLQIIRSVLMVVEMMLFAYGLRYISLADAHAIMSSFPLIVTGLSVLFLAEKIGVRRMTAIAIGFLGMLLITRPGFLEFNAGTLIILACAFIYSGFIVITRKVAQVDHTDTSLFYQSSVGIVVAGLFVPFAWVWPDQDGWLLFLALSVLAAVSYASITMALQLADASYVQPFSYTLLVWAMLWSYLVFNEFPDHYTLLGAGLIVMGGLYALRRERIKMQEQGDVQS